MDLSAFVRRATACLTQCKGIPALPAVLIFQSLWCVWVPPPTFDGVDFFCENPPPFLILFGLSKHSVFACPASFPISLPSFLLPMSWKTYHYQSVEWRNFFVLSLYQILLVKLQT
jgi:hypothetical protein